MDLIARAAGWAEEMLGGESPLWLHVRKVVELCGQILPPGAMMPGAAGASRTAGAAGAAGTAGAAGAAGTPGAAGAAATSGAGTPVDREILLLAAYLHDVGYATGPPPGHEVRSAEMAREFLLSNGVPAERVERVVQTILAHVRPVYGEQREKLSPEAKILYDADKLQRASGLTALGVIWEAARESPDQSPADFRSLLAQARRQQEDVYGSLYTDRARQLASEGYRAALNFIDALSRLV